MSPTHRSPRRDRAPRTFRAHPNRRPRRPRARRIHPRGTRRSRTPPHRCMAHRPPDRARRCRRGSGTRSGRPCRSCRMLRRAPAPWRTRRPRTSTRPRSRRRSRAYRSARTRRGCTPHRTPAGADKSRRHPGWAHSAGRARSGSDRGRPLPPPGRRPHPRTPGPGCTRLARTAPRARCAARTPSHRRGPRRSRDRQRTPGRAHRQSW